MSPLLCVLSFVALSTTAAPAKTTSTPDSNKATLLLPLSAKGTVTTTQAAGVTFLLREELKRSGLVQVLSESSRDKAQAEACDLDNPADGDEHATATTSDAALRCWRALLTTRGADVVVTGALTGQRGGLVASLRAVTAGTVRNAQFELTGDDADAQVYARAVRELVAPEALTGALFVEGDVGSTVILDGKAVATLPLAAQIAGLSEGEHQLEVRHDGKRWQREVHIVHGETTMVRALLLHDIVEPPPFPLTATIIASSGGALLALSAITAALTVWTTLDVEARAREQQLLFPRDNGLLWRGRILAATTDVSAVAGVFLVGAGGYMLWQYARETAAPTAPESKTTPKDAELPDGDTP